MTALDVRNDLLRPRLLVLPCSPRNQRGVRVRVEKEDRNPIAARAESEVRAALHPFVRKDVRRAGATVKERNVVAKAKVGIACKPASRAKRTVGVAQDATLPD